MNIIKITPLGTAKDLFFPIIKKKECSYCHKKTSSYRKECYFCKKGFKPAIYKKSH